VGAPESLFLWQWQLGRILEAVGDRAGAISAHKEAIATLAVIRSDLVAGFGSGRTIFEDSVRPLILGLTDLLLHQSERAGSDAERQALLVEARGTVELLKAAEIEDYFHDDCLAALRAKKRDIDALPPGTAALYPVVLSDRIELLMSRAGRLERVIVPTDEAELERLVRTFRSGLTDPESDAYLPPAQRLYEWLIAPIEARLTASGVSTLVIIPTGSFATIPFAALHDGKAFLIERFALAVAPGLVLTDPQPLSRLDAQALVGGLSEGVGNFPALPHVADELAAVNDAFPSVILRDQDFVTTGLEDALASTPYRIVHMATHAQFEPEALDSFLLTYDGRLDMADLEKLVKLGQFRDEPVELLTLSACTTAVGDDRAALGLAGLGIKAGARSALASLWLVNDRSTAQLIARFYQALTDTEINKAQALRRAQLALSQGTEFRHPHYWAPFLLIGNWL
jgi:CHAT domain-containing protein